MQMYVYVHIYMYVYVRILYTSIYICIYTYIHIGCWALQERGLSVGAELLETPAETFEDPWKSSQKA